MLAMPRSKSIATVPPNVVAALECSTIPISPTRPQKNVKQIGIAQSTKGRPKPRGSGGAAARAEKDW